MQAKPNVTNNRDFMKNLIEKLEWWFDYYLVFLLYNPNKIERYYQFMEEKWEVPGERIPNHLKDVATHEMDENIEHELEAETILFYI